MKTKQRSDVEVSGNLGGEELDLSLDQDSLPHLMEMYTRIYQEPEEAVIREYATNARDSMIAAGKSKLPIKITLPNKLQPVLTISDTGVGLSEDDFREIYSKYGASTKRKTNKQTGSLGIGCKSALAYCAGFNIVGVKDGRKSIVTVTRSKVGGSMRIINPGGSPTNEPNGVTVEIPAPLDNEFMKWAAKIFRFWPKGSVLVDGQEIEPVDGLWITNKILIVNSSNIDSNYIVMGGVPYSYHNNIIESRAHKVVAFVEMGSVDFAPSRETLELTPDTKKRIEQIGVDASAGLAISIQKKIDKAKTHVEAARIMAENVSLVDMRSHTFFYKGDEIPYSIETVVISSSSSAYRQGDHDRSRSVGIQAYTKQLIVTDYTPNSFVASHKKKLMQYVRDKDLYPYDSDDSSYYRNRIQNFLCLPDPPKEMLKWVDPKYIVDWETIRKIKIPIEHGGRAKTAGTYECWNPDGYVGKVEEDDVDSKNLLLYTTEYKTGPTRQQTRLLKRYHNKYTIAYMAGNRKKKFLRLFPKAVHLEMHTRDLADRFRKELTETEKTYIKHTSYREILKKLNPAQIKDTELRKLIRIMQSDQHEKVRAICSDLDIYFPETGDPFKDYPLLSNNSGYYSPSRKAGFAEHAVIYINAVCSGKTKQKKGTKVNV